MGKVITQQIIEDIPDCEYEVLEQEKILKGRQGYETAKRVQDIVLSLIALIILSPLMLVTAVIIYLDDPKGSPIFKQVRCGRNGKTFVFYKFRSMCIDAEEKREGLLKDNEMDGPIFKMKNDPRVTRIGRFIRKTSIDELPQIWNILKGDMSIVGPRPALLNEVEQYNDYQKQRLYITPGLTCYWQAQHNRNSLTFDEWLELDIKYIKERSFITDWKIIFKTIGAVISCDGI